MHNVNLPFNSFLQPDSICWSEPEAAGASLTSAVKTPSVLLYPILSQKYSLI